MFISKPLSNSREGEWDDAYLDAPLWDEVTLVEHDDTLTNPCTGKRGRSGGVFGELHALCAPSAQCPWVC
jgi:hypothetical protein